MEDRELKFFLKERAIHYAENTVVKPYLTMGIGGIVRMVIVAYHLDRLKELLIYLNKNKHPYIFLGGGSNVIFPDSYSSLIVVVNRTSGIYKETGDYVRVNTGVFIKDLMKWTIVNNAGGMEFLAGIPGTVGGAAAVNAGAFGQSISQILDKAVIITKSNDIRTIDSDYFQFRYRNSRFKYSDEVILDVYLKYNPFPGEEIKKQVETKIRYRSKNHPGPRQHSAGCFFKNPEREGKKLSAGRLIEEAGFKGLIYKDLQVSNAHANFIVNSKGASFQDVWELENRIREKVSQDKNITLEREVIYISPEGKKY